jgi:hypothetical protein
MIGRHRVWLKKSSERHTFTPISRDLHRSWRCHILPMTCAYVLQLHSCIYHFSANSKTGSCRAFSIASVVTKRERCQNSITQSTATSKFSSGTNAVCKARFGDSKSMLRRANPLRLRRLSFPWEFTPKRFAIA